MGLFGALFGSGAKSSSSSDNQAYPWIKDTYGSMAQNGVGANNVLSGLLTGDDGEFNAGYDRFKSSAGYQNVLDTAMRGLSGSAGSRGMLRSGSTLKALQDRAAGIGDQYFTNYLGQLSNLSGQGLNAGQLITSAGQRSQSSEKGASGGILGGIASIFSDRRLKRNIELLERAHDSLGIYAFRYDWDGPDAPERVGVMADEVGELRPWALGPVVDGFATVDYSNLEAR